MSDGRIDISDFAPNSLHGFQATASLNGSDLESEISLSGPVEIIARDGTEFRAYQLVESFPARDGEKPSQIWYLDAELHLVAAVERCGYVGNCNNSERLEWQREGELPPLGLAYPYLLREGALTTTSGGQTRDVSWEDGTTNVSSGELKVWETSPWTGEVLPIEYRYHPQHLLPSSGQRTITSYTAGERLTGADRLALPRDLSLEARPWDGLMFPGEDVEHFDLGASHLQIVLEAFPELAIGGSSCIREYYLRIAEQTNGTQIDDALGAVGLDEPYETAMADVQAILPSGVLQTVQITVFRNSSGDEVNFERNVLSSRPTSLMCDDVYGSPWPELDFEAGLGYARSQLPDGPIRIFSSFAASRLSWQEPETGWHSFRFGVKPEAAGAGQFSEYHEIDFKPTDGTMLNWAVLPPDNRFH